MLYTILRYFENLEYNEDYDDEYSNVSPTRSVVRDTMAYTGHDDHDDDHAVGEEEEWEQVSIPLSAGEDFEIVFEPSGFPPADDAASTPASAGNNSGGIFQRIREWRNQRSLQRTQLGRSISNTFAELSKEDPNQMEEEAIQRAMELSMLDFALVPSRHSSNTHFQQQQQKAPSPNTILGVTNNASPTEIKNAYRRLARQHVSYQSNAMLCLDFRAL